MRYDYDLQHHFYQSTLLKCVLESVVAPWTLVTKLLTKTLSIFLSGWKKVFHF